MGKSELPVAGCIQVSGASERPSRVNRGALKIKMAIADQKSLRRREKQIQAPHEALAHCRRGWGGRMLGTGRALVQLL